jgi:tetratricopeptide (TPR) repeat protein
MGNEWQASREWVDISTKWRLVPTGLRSSRPDDPFAQGWLRMEAGDLEQAQRLFEEACRVRGDGNDYVALGDVHVAHRDWVAAEAQFQRALVVAPLSILAVLGLALVRAATGHADTAVAELDVLARTRKGDPVIGYYLAVALLARTVEVRTETGDGRLLIGDERQLEQCEDLARRVALSGTDDAELLAAARSLLAEAQSGREWIWTAPRNAAFLGGVAAVFGVVPIILGGLLNSWPLVVAGLVVGAAAIFYAVFQYRRQRWQLRALSR